MRLYKKTLRSPSLYRLVRGRPKPNAPKAAAPKSPALSPRSPNFPLICDPKCFAPCIASSFPFSAKNDLILGEDAFKAELNHEPVPPPTKRRCSVARIPNKGKTLKDQEFYK